MSSISKRFIGDIGEFLAAKYLESMGYAIVRYGKEMHRGEALKHLRIQCKKSSDSGVGFGWKHDFSNYTEDELLNHYRNFLPYGDDFLFINYAVNEYIKRFWWHYSEKNIVLHDAKKILALQKSGQIAKAEDLKEKNRQILKKFPGSGDYPGRYDFICVKDGHYMAVEVKVNSSKLSYWQSIRFGMIRRFGGDACVLKITISKEDMKRFLVDSECDRFSLSMELFDNSTVDEIPTDQDFMMVMNFVARHERGRNKYGVI